MFADQREALRELQAAVARFTDAFDPAAVALPDAPPMLDDATRLVNMATTLQALLAGRVADGSAWQQAGARSPAEFVAKRTGTSTGQAKERLETARRLESQPKVAEAARRGELSAQQTAAITDAAAANPGAADVLLELAPRASLGELRDECGRRKSAADTDAEARRARVHRDRFCRKYACTDGSAEIVCHGTPDAIAEVWAVVQGWTDRIFRTARAEGRRESPEAYAFDAMVEMARAARGGSDGAAKPVPAKVIVRVDWDALVRGWPLEGETCEIAGVGSVPVSVVETILDSGNTFLAAVITKGGDVVNVAHLGRRFTAEQVTGLEWRDPICAALGCNCTWRLEKDHRLDWAGSRITLLALADRLCAHHHHLKTNDGWMLVDGLGKRPMVPPDHPHHPKNRRPGGDEPRPRSLARLAT